VCFLRADESLFFANSRELEQVIYHQLTDQPNLTDLVLVCSAINSIDYTALEMLERVNENLAEQNVALHLCEVKGPVMDKLKSTHLLHELHQRVYLSTNDAFASLEAKSRL
jgi:SulP family sulfate permease